MQVMPFYHILLHVFVFVSSSYQAPFIFNDDIEFCTYSTSDERNKIVTNSDIRFVEFDGLKIYFKLCGKFDREDDHCPAGTVACLINQRSGKKTGLGTGFRFDEGDILTSLNGGPCGTGKTISLVVHLRHSSQKPFHMYLEHDCNYHINTIHPGFRSACGLNVYGRFLDLSPLNKSFLVQHAEQNISRTFSVTLCGPDQSCGRNLSACEIAGPIVTPLALTSTIWPNYAGENHLVFHGHFINQTRKPEKVFEVILKCDWEKNEIRNDDLRYVPKQIQGKRYTFELETSYGCIKKPIPCVVRDEFLIYNLSELYLGQSKMWSTHHRNSKFFLQVCGPVVLAGKNTSCQNTYAQVCENVDGIDINRGSILSRLDVTTEGLRAVVDSGTKCKEVRNPKSHYTTVIQYTTVIDFVCDYREDGPRVLNSTRDKNSCDTYFTWKTPKACPKYDASACSHIHKESHECSFDIFHNSYNLTALSTMQMFRDKRLPNITFEINICGPIVDPEAPCMQDVSVAMKNLSEPNVRHRTISLGKFRGTSQKNGSLVLKYSTGAYCGGGGDYSCEIRFDCSETEEGLEFVKRDKCHYEFLWKTAHGCPSPKDSDAISKELSNMTDCSYVHSFTGQSVDFKDVKPLAFDDGKFMNTFHVCGKLYSNCTRSKQNCTNIKFENPTLHFSGNVTSLEINVPAKCSTPEAFDKVTFNFLCDRIPNNGHMGSWNRVDCGLSVDYYLNTVCASQDSYRAVESLANNESPQAEEPERPESLPVESPAKRECSITSPFTNHKLNMRNFTNSFFKSSCPTTAVFNDTFRFVKLLYSSDDVCLPVPSKNISYEVYLMCSHDVTFTAGNEACRQHFNYEQAEYCNLFKAPAKANAWIIVGTVLGCTAVISLICVGFWVHKRRKRWTTSSNEEFVSIYERVKQKDK